MSCNQPGVSNPPNSGLQRQPLWRRVLLCLCVVPLGGQADLTSQLSLVASIPSLSTPEEAAVDTFCCRPGRLRGQQYNHTTGPGPAPHF